MKRAGCLMLVSLLLAFQFCYPASFVFNRECKQSQGFKLLWKIHLVELCSTYACLVVFTQLCDLKSNVPTTLMTCFLPAMNNGNMSPKWYFLVLWRGGGGEGRGLRRTVIDIDDGLECFFRKKIKALYQTHGPTVCNVSFAAIIKKI